MAINHYNITAYKIKLKSDVLESNVTMGEHQMIQPTIEDSLIIVTDDILNIIDQLPREKIETVDNLGPACYLVTPEKSFES